MKTTNCHILMPYIRQYMQEVSSNDEIRCLLITDTGRGLCEGQDLSDLDVSPEDKTDDLGYSVKQNYNPLIRSIKKLEKPVICAVNGVATGAGSSLTLACYIVYAARSATFIQSFSKIGLVPDSGGSWALPRLVGHSRTMGLAMYPSNYPQSRLKPGI
jgi:2-(1,2-epoxy-1,2-dihydrophenyl)acetyl-CoA isomerase